MTQLLQVGDLRVRPTVEPGAPTGNEVLRGLDLTVDEGEVHAIVGPNGSGSSTLGPTLLGSPGYEVTAGSVVFRGDDVTNWPTDERAKAGMYLAFRRPRELPGVSLLTFLHRALSTRTHVVLSVPELRDTAMEWLLRLGIDPAFADRHLDGAFTPDERQASEVVQMAILEPRLAILDRTGSDPDQLHTLATGIRHLRHERPTIGTVLLADDPRALAAIGPDRVHVLADGRIIATGGTELAHELESDGHDSFRAMA